MTNELEPKNPLERALELAVQQHALTLMGDLATKPALERGDDGFDFRRFLGILLRRKWVLVACGMIAAAAALVHTYNTTPMYRSTLLLQIEPQTDQFLEFQGNISFDAKLDWKYYQTQYDLLRSQSLARRVIDQLGLEAAAGARPPAQDQPSFLSELKGAVRQWLASAASGRSEANPGGTSARASPSLEGALLANLTIEPLRDSRLVRIHYDSPRPQEAAAVANAVAQNFINLTLERRYDATAYAKKFLEERIEQVRANLEDSEKRLIAYAKEREIVDLEDKLGSLMQTLNAMNQALVGVEAERIRAEAQYAQTSKGGGGIALAEDSGLIQALKTRKGELELEYQEQLKVFKPGYPKMQQLKRQIDEIDQQIRAEIASIGEAGKAGYEAKLQEQASLQTRVSQVKAEILDLQNRSTDYQALKREVDTNRELYDGLLQRMKEVGVVAGVTTNNISIVDPAKVPGSAYKPNLKNNLALALGIGLMVGVLLAYLLEHMDDSVKTAKDLEGRVRLPVLGVIPMASTKGRGMDAKPVALLAAEDPKSPLAEAARSLRTSLMLSTSEGAPKLIHVTSPGPGEGKSTVASNVAIAFAQAGGKVLIVDADLRSPSLHGAFSLPNSLGLSNYLTSDIKPAEIAQPTQVLRLFAITSGPLPPNPVELLSGAKMLDLLSIAAERFDYVIVDGPPVIGLADAVVLGSICNGTIFVVDAGRTRYGQIDGAMKRLRAANVTILGTVVDRFGRDGHGYGYGYGYGYDYDYRYTYSYGGREEGRALPESA